MDMITIDRVVALCGFIITLWQLHKTRSAAQAARESANSAFSAVRRLEAATKMHDISSRSRELHRLLRSKSLIPAAAAAFELRDTVARYQHNDHSKLIVSVEVWSQTVSEVAAVHERLESLSLVTRTSQDDREALLHEVGRLHTFFTNLAAQAGANGAINANTN